MLATVRNCCRILWKRRYSKHPLRRRMLVLGLCLLAFGATTALGDPVVNQRSQRRFMWTNMDHSMDGLMDSMSAGARAMRNMFTDLLPSMQSTALPGMMHGNILDYLPSETTRVKYIIRSPPPNSKPLKIIKIRSPKKVIKIMAPPKAGDFKPHKPLKVHFPNAEQMRKLEKEQELIAEGRAPAKGATSTPAPHYETYTQLKQGGGDDDIVSGKIHYGDGWTPVQEDVRKPNTFFETVKSYPMSELHTSILANELPPAQKQIYEQAAEEDVTSDGDDDDFEDHDHHHVHQHESEQDETRHEQQYQAPAPAPAPVPHSYEVTEYTGEETVALPLTQAFPHPHPRGYFAGRGVQAASTMPSSSAPPSTEEPPNYPASFLRRQREQQRTTSTPLPLVMRFKQREAVTPAADSSAWTPLTNSSYPGLRARPAAATQQHHQHQHHEHHQHHHHHQAAHTKVRQKSEKWPPEVPPPRPFVAMADTAAAYEAAEAAAGAQTAVRAPRKNVKLKAPSTEASDKPFASYRDIKQRGSVKFGDKL